MTEPDASLKEAYRRFESIYRGRQDCAAVKREGSYRQIADGLTFERFREHVTLVNTYAIYQMDSCGNVSFCLYDLDVLPRKQPPGAMSDKLKAERDKALRVIRTLSSTGIRSENILMEFPTVGYHLILGFSRPVPAAAAKRFMEITLGKSGLAKTPFYPRTIAEGTTGDRIQLPFRMNSNTGRRSNLINDIASFDPEDYDPEPDFSPLERIRPVDADLILEMAA